MINDLINVIKKNQERKKKEKEFYKKQYNSLTIQELESYHNLLDKKRTDSWSTLVTFPLYMAFYIGIFTIVMSLAFNIDIRIPMLLIIKLLFAMWPLFFCAALLTIILDMIAVRKASKNLLRRKK